MYETLQIFTININEEFTDISKICEDLTITSVLEGSASSLDFSYLASSGVNIVEGNVVYVKLNGKIFFYGWVFKKDVSYNDTVKIRAYDIKRYLKYTDVDVTGNETIDQLFKRICEMANIKYIITDKSSFIIPSKIHDGVSYNDIIQFGLDQTFINNNKERFCIRSNEDKLELLNVNNNQKNIVIGDYSLITNYQFSTDIENTYTAFKIQRELDNKEEKKLTQSQRILNRKTFTLQPKENIKKWGVLQYYEKKDSKWTDAQLNELINKLNTTYNKQTKTLKVNGLGHEDCIVGNMIPLNIQNLHKENVAKGTYVLITESTHKFSHGDWQMELTLEIS